MGCSERCKDCPRRDEPAGLYRDSVGGKWSGGRGPVPAELLIVGMAPGKDELLCGEPFVGESGEMLERALRFHGGGTESCRILNVVNCYPLGRADSLTSDQIEACRERFLSEVHAANPKVILTLGGEAFNAVTGWGKRETVTAWRGYPIRGDASKAGLPLSVRWILPTFHPSFVMRKGFGPLPWFRKDVGVAWGLQFNEPEFSSDPGQGRGIEDAEDHFDVGVDIETAGFHGEIRRIGVAAGGSAVSLPWNVGSHRGTQRLLSGRSKRFIFHNGMFDIPRLEDAGCGIAPEAEIWDTLLAAQRVDPDAPGFSLNALASFYLLTERWKHLGSERYRPRRPKLQTWKKPQACFECSADTLHGEKLEGKTRRCSVCAERTYRSALAEFESKDEVYNRRDAFHLLEIQRIQEAELLRTGQLESFQQQMRVFRILIEMHKEGIAVDRRARDRIARRMLRWEEKATAEWTAAAGCSPGAFAKIAKLLYEEWGLPRQFKTELEGGRKVQKLTSDEEALQTLISLGGRKRELKMLLWARHYSKWRKTYCEIEERIHPSFAPGEKDEASGKRFSAGAATGRLIAKGGTFRGKPTPPIQQMPKGLRRMFVPEEGCVFVECDDSSQELRIAAWYYKDEKLIRKIESGFDIHAENVLRWKVDRTRAKNGFYGGVYGSSGRGIQRAMKAEGYDVSLAFCEDIVRDLKAQYPDLFRNQLETLKQVAVDRYLANPFGRRRYFWAPERSRNEILNFPIQSIGADMLWRRLPEVHALAREFRGGLKTAVHDSILISIPEYKVEEFIPRLREVMEQEFPEVGKGFRVPVDIKIGRAWHPMRKRTA